MFLYLWIRKKDDLAFFYKKRFICVGTNILYLRFLLVGVIILKHFYKID